MSHKMLISIATKENYEPRFIDILITLTNLTQILANITARMDKLEIKQSPKIPNRKLKL